MFRFYDLSIFEDVREREAKDRERLRDMVKKL